ncbi:exodeoxyribonuclease V subunit gamma [Buchnera aphidicola]|uniref:exodeoxyribonuclease V subunit gamma n=1 Tax=Buchnera aphidicola TaxID=9 RepID=UPI00130E5318
MIEAYISNKLEFLIKKACNIIQNTPTKNPLQKEIFIIDNKEVSQWIKIFIANYSGISSNIEFYTLHEFIWKIFKYILPHCNNEYYNNVSLFWKIMALQETENFYKIGFNATKSSIKKSHFASYFSILFQKYMVQRPNWILNWEQDIINYNTTSHSKLCQSKLWKLIINCDSNKLKYNFSNLFEKLLAMNNINYLKSKWLFASRITICSIYNLNYTYLLLLNKLSRLFKIILLCYSPFNTLKFLKNDNKKVLTFHNVCNNNFFNPILKFLGKFDYTKLLILNSQQIKKTIYTHSNYQSNLLRKIQFDITYCQHKIQNNYKKFFCKHDTSISIHACYNFKREIEILHDNLINVLNKNDSIKPKDILVVSNNISNYTPFINSIFNTVTKKFQIPYIIHNKNINYNNSIFNFFKKILTLSENIYTTNEILSYLRLPFINKKFCFSEEELILLEQFITHTNIKWGISNQHLKEISIPCNKYNTWKYGIDRMFLGYAIQDKNVIWNSILSCNFPNNLNINIINKLSKFITVLNKWRKILQHSKLLKNWLPLCTKIINDFFHINNSEVNKKTLIIKNVWNTFINTGIKNNYKKKFL